MRVHRDRRVAVVGRQLVLGGGIELLDHMRPPWIPRSREKDYRLSLGWFAISKCGYLQT
jgi:hypothetical protein